jgi:hypothetical protein
VRRENIFCLGDLGSTVTASEVRQSIAIILDIQRLLRHLVSPMTRTKQLASILLNHTNKLPGKVHMLFSAYSAVKLYSFSFGFRL